MSLAEHISNRLGRSKRSGEWHQCQCPCHDDGRASLHIKDNDRNSNDVVLDCKAGCDWKDIKDELRARGLLEDWKDPSIRRTDPYREQKKPSVHRFNPYNIYYSYHSATGQEIFRVCRMQTTDGKRFMQITPSEDEKTWLNRGPKKEDLVLYRLPEVLSAIHQQRLVFVVEGEKDVENLRKEGFIATCNPMGACKWLHQYSYMLLSALVIILPDNDAVGATHAHHVRDSLANIARSVTVIRLPDLPKKGDVSDWFEAGNTGSDFKQVVSQALKKN